MTNNVETTENMEHSGLASAPGAPFVVINSVNAQTATPSDVTLENIKKHIKLDRLRLQHLDEFMKVKGKDKPIILIGGGSSINKPENLSLLKEMAAKYPTVACGSVHDWLIEHGIIPTYAAACDPDPVMANYFTKPHKDVKYLIATGCDDKVFEVLHDYNIIMWHCHSEENHEAIKEIEPSYQAIGGGCTVGMRAISIVLMLGYSNLHFFGFDSCLDDEDNNHHAYEFSTDQEQLGQIYLIKIGIDGPGESTYKCAGYQLVQADNFEKLYNWNHHLFTPTLYGRGLIKDMVEQMNIKRARLEEAARLAQLQQQVA